MKEFYSSAAYKEKQANLTKLGWQLGRYQKLRAALIKKICKNQDCKNPIETKQYDPKLFCSKSCAAHYNNSLRHHTLESRQKISESLKGNIPWHKGKILVPRLKKNCLKCKKDFETTRWKNHQYCSTICSIRDIGSRRTSPRAARGKSGIREDISLEICFYSRWEANFARTLNLLNIQWEFQPKTFDLEVQKYTPDFYLPAYDTWVEIKNFLSDYSQNRDTMFRKLYPDHELLLVLKPDYLMLQDQFAHLIPNWEFNASKEMQSK